MNILCSGPGPHDPPNGIVGTGDHQVNGLFCLSPRCQPNRPPADPDATPQPVQVTADQIAAARDQLAKATTLGGVKGAMASVLDALDPNV